MYGLLHTKTSIQGGILHGFPTPQNPQGKGLGTDVTCSCNKVYHRTGSSNLKRLTLTRLPICPFSALEILLWDICVNESPPQKKGQHHYSGMSSGRERGGLHYPGCLQREMSLNLSGETPSLASKAVCYSNMSFAQKAWTNEEWKKCTETCFPSWRRSEKFSLKKWSLCCDLKNG